MGVLLPLVTFFCVSQLAPTFHYSGFLGFLTFGFGMYYTHFYLPKRVNWKEW